MNGYYSPGSLPALSKIIPGEYQVRISRANYARIVDTLSFSSLQVRNYSRVMNPTSNAYLHGNVVNEFGNPVIGASVNACGTILSTDEFGIFDMEVNAGCTSLSVSCTKFETINDIILSMTAGLETLLGAS